MKNKSLAMLSPVCLALFAGSARADLEPFSFGASENLQHQSNINHTDSAVAHNVSDWVSTTELNAAIDEPVGRDKLTANAAVDFNRYKRLHGIDSTGYHAATEFDWNTIGDLSGSLGADSHRSQYFNGQTSDFSFGGTPIGTTTVRNLQTDSHAFARISLGGPSRWTIFGGADANRRNYSNDLYKINDQRQWSTNLGTRYATSPDLNFGIVGSYTRGDYPQGSLQGTESDFNSKSVSATTDWQASGNSHLSASLGGSAYFSDAFGGTRHFANGSLSWVWTPPSHISVNLLLRRSSDADTSGGVATGIQGASSLNGTSINNAAHLLATYSLTAKTNIDASIDYTQRKYENLITILGEVSGTTRTARLFLTVRYQPTRTTDLSCGAGRETSHADASLMGLAQSYNDNYLQCMASIRFD